MKKILTGNIILLLASFVFVSCNKDDSDVLAELTGNMEVFPFDESGNSGINGEVKFEERLDNSTLITLSITGGNSGDSYPALIYMGTAANSGSILLILTNVSGETNESETNVSFLSDGSKVTYTDLITMDANIKLLKSDNDLGTILATADIGENVLSGKSETIVILNGGSETAILTMAERISGTTLITISLTGGGDQQSHPAHIHENTVIEGGSIIVTLNNLDENTGISQTDIDSYDDGTGISYAGLIAIDGHLKVHKSESDFATIIASGDVGQNTLTGQSKTYELVSVSEDNISGTVIFRERKNSSTIVSMQLTGTTAGANHATHIHQNSALIGGSIKIGFSNVTGESGISETNITEIDDGTPITYGELIAYDGHIVVHPNPSQFSIVAIGDIGSNELTGESKMFTLSENGGSGMSGNILFEQRINGFTIATIQLTGTAPNGDHPVHIHENNAAQGGTILIDFTNVNGSGLSLTDVRKNRNGDEVNYENLLDFNGHVVIHKSQAEFGVVVVKGNIGSNAN